MNQYYNSGVESPVKGGIPHQQQQQQQQVSPQSVVVDNRTNNTSNNYSSPSSTFSFDPYSPHSNHQSKMNMNMNMSMNSGTPTPTTNQNQFAVQAAVQPQYQYYIQQSQPQLTSLDQQYIYMHQQSQPLQVSPAYNNFQNQYQQHYQNTSPQPQPQPSPLLDYSQQSSIPTQTYSGLNYIGNNNGQPLSNYRYNSNYTQFQPPTIKVNNDHNFTSHSSSSPQTTPTNQPITTTTPTAPKKGPRTNNFHDFSGTDTPTSIDDPFGLNRPRRRERSSSITSSRSRRSTTSSTSSKMSSTYSSSIINDESFAPPPPFPENLTLIKERYFVTEPNSTSREVKSTLPSFGLVKHSGEVMGRFSMKSMIMKKWKYIFWIAYGDNQILVFRSKMDFEEWVSNPYLTKSERDKLVKVSFDFVNDLFKPMVKGYSVTSVRKKNYGRNGLL